MISRARTLVFGILVVGVLASAALAVVRGAWELHLAVDALLAIYVSWLLEEKHRRTERRRRVRSLQSARRARPVEPLRAAAGER